MFLTKTVSTRASVFLLGSAVVVFFVIVFYAQQTLKKFDIATAPHTQASANCDPTFGC